MSWLRNRITHKHLRICRTVWAVRKQNWYSYRKACMHLELGNRSRILPTWLRSTSENLYKYKWAIGRGPKSEVDTRIQQTNHTSFRRKAMATPYIVHRKQPARRFSSRSLLRTALLEYCSSPKEATFIAEQLRKQRDTLFQRSSLTGEETAPTSAGGVFSQELTCSSAERLPNICSSFSRIVLSRRPGKLLRTSRSFSKMNRSSPFIFDVFFTESKSTDAAGSPFAVLWRFRFWNEVHNVLPHRRFERNLWVLKSGGFIGTLLKKTYKCRDRSILSHNWRLRAAYCGFPRRNFHLKPNFAFGRKSFIGDFV